MYIANACLGLVRLICDKNIIILGFGSKNKHVFVSVYIVVTSVRPLNTCFTRVSTHKGRKGERQDTTLVLDEKKLATRRF